MTDIQTPGRRSTPLSGLPVAGAVTSVVARKLASHTAVYDDDAALLSDLIGAAASFRPGAMIAATGDRLDHATLMIEGLACRSKILADGRRQILSLLLPGDVIDAHASLLGERDDNIEALTPCWIGRIAQARLVAVGLPILAWPRRCCAKH
jgi:CRP-like cAMP-binding protein